MFNMPHLNLNGSRGMLLIRADLATSTPVQCHCEILVLAVSNMLSNTAHIISYHDDENINSITIILTSLA